MALSAQKHLRHLKSLSEVSTVGGQDQSGEASFIQVWFPRWDLFLVIGSTPDYLPVVGHIEKPPCSGEQVGMGGIPILDVDASITDDGVNVVACARSSTPSRSRCRIGEDANVSLSGILGWITSTTTRMPPQTQMPEPRID